MGVKLAPHQLDALGRMHNGCILCGGVGSGKSITALAYYYILNGGALECLTGGRFIKLYRPTPIYIITTARKRDDMEWELELTRFQMDISSADYSIVIDSWNNIEKYKNVKNGFFIFDEQRVPGYGKWAQTFIYISKYNQWIMLSATPGDQWMDYVPVFIANGYFKTKKEFTDHHVIYRPFSKFPQIDRYFDEQRLIRLRDRVLVDMPFLRETERHVIDVRCQYDIPTYKFVQKERKNPWTYKPIRNVSEFCQTLRKIINSDDSRIQHVLDICKERRKVIIFYNYDYELDILKAAPWPKEFELAEWNGHMHQPIPEGKAWVYLVQYTAGCEGWNCVSTDSMIFYSQTYSYKQLEQSMGRIDRMNTRFRDLYYYNLRSMAPIDVAISRALRNKKRFNETKFAGIFERKDEL